MMLRKPRLPRLSRWLDLAVRRVGPAALLAGAGLVAAGIPAAIDDALFGALSPAPASAICSPDPRATGYLTANGSYNATSPGPAKIDSSTGDINSATVYAYISSFNGTNDGGSSGQKNCGNPVYRYGGLAWLTNSSTATLDWGAFTGNGSSSGCYPLYGTNDYFHANSTSTCVWNAGGNPGINYHVLAISLAPANQQYRRNSSGLVNAGDFEFIQDSCSTFYQDTSGTGEVLKTGVAKSDLTVVVGNTTAISWKPGANCGGSLTQDNTDTAQSFWYDTTAPTASFSVPLGNSGTTSATLTTNYTVNWTETEAGSGVATRSLQRKVAPFTSSCGTFASDGTPVTTASPVTATGLLVNHCYQWLQTLTDKAGNTLTTTSGNLIVDPGPTATFSTPATGSTIDINSTSYTVAWTETAGAGTISSRSLQRQRALVVTSGMCTGLTFANDGSPVTSVSPVAASGLSSGYAYQWVQTLTNSYGDSAPSTSGCLIVDTTAPIATISAPQAGQADHSVIDVLGTATDHDTFRDWTLEYGVGASPTTWLAVASGTNQVTGPGGFVGNWDSRALTGLNTLRLTVRDWAGNSTQMSTTVLLENTERGAEPYRTDVPFALGGGWDLAIATDTGEARLSRDLFSIPSFGPAQALSLTYSSLVPDAGGRFGVGWSSNLTQYLTFEGSYIVWHRADGARVPFGQVGGVWTPLRGHFETFSQGTEDVVTLTDQTRLVFESSGNGRLKRIENRYGKALTLVWNSSSATATDASGRVMNLTINSSKDRITAVTDSAGRSWAFGYATGNTNDLVSVTDPAGNVTTLAYDSNHLLTTITRTRTPAVGSAQTVTWSIAYTAGKATSVTDPINATVSNTLTYNSGNTVVGLLKTYSPVVRNTATYAFNYAGANWTLATTDPGGYTTTRTYDNLSRLISINRPVGLGPTYQVVTYTYDRSNVASETAQLDGTHSVVTVNTYNATNDLVTRSEADTDAAVKLATLNTYDGSGHLTSVDVNCTSTGTTSPTPASSCTGAGTQDASTNLITTYSYTANDQLFDLTDPLGLVTQYTYDTFGNQTSVTRNYASGVLPSADVNVVSAAAFDQATTAGKAGLATSSTDPVGNVTTYTYDLLGHQLTQVFTGDATIPALTKTNTFDEFGNLLTETQAWTGITRTTTHVYDLANRETSVTDPSGLASSTGYDAAGDSVSSASGGVTTTRAFDGLGDPLTETVGSSTTQHAYDPAGNELETVDPSGVTTDRTFDLAGRQLTETTGGLTTTSTYDSRGQLTQSTDPSGLVTQSTYDRPGRNVETIVDTAVTWNTYDRAGNVVSTLDPTGSVTATIRDGLDRTVQTITNCTNSGTTPPAGGVVCAGTGTVNATTNISSYTYYDAAGNSLGSKDPAGFITRNVINVRNLVAETIADCTNTGNRPTSDAPSCNGSGTADDITNIDTTFSFDGSGAPTGSVAIVHVGGNSVQITTATAYDSSDRAIASLDAMGTITRTFFDTNGNVSSTVVNCTNTGTTVPTSGWATCAGTGTHDGTFNLTTSYTYDSHGNKVTETAPNGRVTQYAYDAADRVASQTANYTSGSPAPDQNLTTYFAYDSAGRQIAVRAPTADRTTFTVTGYRFDSAGRLVGEDHNCTVSGTTPPADPAWRTCNDQSGGTLDKETNLVTLYTYDDRGNKTAVTAPSPAATATSLTTTFTDYAYDDANRLCRVLENASAVTSLSALTQPCVDAVSGGTTTANVSTRYTYDGAGNLASMIDGRAALLPPGVPVSTVTTSYGYDSSGRMTSLTDPLGHALTWTYDALGRRTAQNNRDGTVVTWAYDEIGRLTTRTATNTATVTYTYDPNGNRLTAGDGTETITTTYDRLNRPTSITSSDDAGANTAYTYNLASTNWTDPTGSYVAALDAFGREINLTDPIHGPSLWATTYRADAQPLTFGAPNGNTTTSTYDSAGRFTGTYTAAGATSRASYAYTLNRAGQRLSEASQITGDPTNGTVTFAYDPLARLTAYSGSPVTSQAYSWDAVPNRITKQIGTAAVVSTTYNAANRPTTDTGGGSYSSDLDGRLTAMPGEQFVWDSLGRLLQVKNGSGAVISTYSYDPLDRLLKVVRTNGTLKFRYVGVTSSVAQARDASDNVLWNVVNGLDGRPRMDFGPGGTSQRFFGTNGHGDTTWTADLTGAVSATLRSDPWGNPGTSSGGSLPDFRFQGSWFDASANLSWSVARWYTPSLGEFISEDTLLGAPQQPATRALYDYGDGDPISNVDPTGHFWYKVRPGDTTTSIALAWFGTTARWTTVFEANRTRLRYWYSEPTAPSCLWIRRTYYATVGDAWWESPIPNQCLPSWYSQDAEITGTPPDSRTIVAARTLGYDFYSFDRSRLVALTQNLTKRLYQPSSDQTALYKRNTLELDYAGAYYVLFGGGSLVGSVGSMWLMTGNSIVNSWACSGQCAFTIGHWVFAYGSYHPRITLPQTDPLLWHEYIHVLQQEGRSLAYALDTLNLSRTEGFGPTNKYEALAYLWQGWADTFRRWDKPPWCSFFPIWGSRPGC